MMQSVYTVQDKRGEIVAVVTSAHKAVDIGLRLCGAVEAVDREDGVRTLRYAWQATIKGSHDKCAHMRRLELE